MGLAHIALRIRSFSNDDGEGDRDDDGDDRTSKNNRFIEPTFSFYGGRKLATNFFFLFLTLSAVPK